MSTEKRLAGRQCASKARDRLLDGGPELQYLGSYATSYAGRSTTATIAKEAVNRHSITETDEVLQWIDAETGAIIMVPTSSIED